MRRVKRLMGSAMAVVFAASLPAHVLHGVPGTPVELISDYTHRT